MSDLHPLFQLLVSKTADLEPRYGWDWTDVPELSATDIELICGAKPGDVIEELGEGDFLDLLVLDAATGKNGATRNPVHIERACRKVLFRYVEEECERRYEENERERDQAAHNRRAGYRVNFA